MPILLGMVSQENGHPRGAVFLCISLFVFPYNKIAEV